MALISCTLILLGVTLLLLVAQQILRDSAAASFNAIDRQFALQSAEAALIDARQALFLFKDAAATRSVQTYGHLTGNTLPHGHGGQIHHLPDFQITIHPLTFTPAQTGTGRFFYRVRVQAVGLRETTQVLLEADFIKPLCVSSGQCLVRDYSRLAWRMLTSLPTDWRAADAHVAN